MDDPDALLPVESAGNLAGISPRTLRYWIRGGKLPAIEGKHGKLVRIGDVLAIADMTGKRTAIKRQSAGTQTWSEDSAGSAGSVAGNNIQGADAAESLASEKATLPATAGAMQAALEVFRDELIRPFVDDLRQAERTIGRLEAERDALWTTVERLEAERDALLALKDASVDANKGPSEAMPTATTEDAGEGNVSRWGRFWRALTGR